MWTLTTTYIFIMLVYCSIILLASLYSMLYCHALAAICVGLQFPSLESRVDYVMLEYTAPQHWPVCIIALITHYMGYQLW